MVVFSLFSFFLLQFFSSLVFFSYFSFPLFFLFFFLRFPVAGGMVQNEVRRLNFFFIRVPFFPFYDPVSLI